MSDKSSAYGYEIDNKGHKVEHMFVFLQIDEDVKNYGLDLIEKISQHQQI